MIKDKKEDRIILQKKAEEVRLISEKIDSSGAVIFADYRGLTVVQITELRHRLRGVGSTINVHKNSLLKRALGTLNVKSDNGAIQGPTALLSLGEDVASGAKEFVKFIKENENGVKIKWGLLQNELLDEKKVRMLASLPSKAELLGKVVSGFNSPIHQFVTTLSSPIRGLVYVLNQIKNKQEVK